MNKIKSTKGITLISLVITIIILIILAGVAINLSLGENGIFRRAIEARDKYLASAEDEQKALNELYKQLGIENLPENTKENPQEIGKEVALKDGWGQETVVYTSTKDGQEVKNLTKVATVYAVSVGNGDTVPVPKNFYYVGGTLENGVIISDAEADKYDGSTDKTTHAYRKNLQGNQFVWIPCSIDNYNFITTYAKNTSANYGYERIPGEIAQIEKYGGFYVGRYEAGICMPTGTNNSGITTANILDGTSASN